jgi:FKBP-type peptidyl-prolyl cis-trans isomerase FklB
MEPFSDYFTKKGILMKSIIIACIGILLTVSVSFAGDKTELKSQNDKVNYSIGYQIGGDFKRQDVEIQSEIIVKGIQDAISGAKPLLTPKEMRTTLVDLKKRITAAQKEKNQQLADKNLAAGKAYLEENSKKKGVTTLPSGLQYKVIRKGSGAMPKETDNVTVHYRGTLINGTEFDSSYRRSKPVTFRADRVIAGWKEALQLMKEGAKWQLFIPANLAYGERGAGAKIPPSSTLVFEVELISVKSVEKKEDTGKKIPQ